MAVEMKGRVGPVTLPDGSIREVSLDRSSAQRTSCAHGRWYEAASRGNVFMGSTVAAGINPGATLNGTTAFVLHNPTGSDVDLVVMAASIGYISGTHAAGTLVAAKYVESAANAAPVTVTDVVPQSTKLGLGKSKARVQSASTLTAAPLIMFQLFDFGAKLATTALQNAPFVVLPYGVFIVTPGTAFCMSGITAAEAGAPVIVIGCLWEEITRAA